MTPATPSRCELLARYLAQQQDRLDDLLPLLGSELRVQLRTLAAQLSDIEQQAMSILGTTAGVASTAPAGSGREGGSVIDPAAGPLGSTAGAARRAAGQVQRDVAASGGGPAAVDGVTGVVGAVGGGAGGTSGGPAATGSTGARGGSLPGASAGTAASTTPLPTAGVPVATPSVPLPLPTSSPGGGSPGGTGPVTGTPPLPSASATPSVPLEVCVPLPPLTIC